MVVREESWFKSGVATAARSMLCATVIAGSVAASAASVTESTVYTFGRNALEDPTSAFVLASDGYLYAAVGTDARLGAPSGGVILRMNPLGGSITPVHAFNAATEGVLPMSLIQASDGNFYGGTLHTTRAGGGGVLFQMTPQGNVTVLHPFDTDPNSPYWALAPLVEGADGSLYGTTYGGGQYYCGEAFKISKSGSYTVLHDFDPATESCYANGLTLAPDGNFYGTTNYLLQGSGVPPNQGAVFRMTPDGTVTVLHVFQDGVDGGRPFGTLTVGPDGNLYGISLYYLSPSIFQVTTAGAFSVIHAFDVAGSQVPAGILTAGSDGNLYGILSTASGANDSGSLYRIATDGSRFSVLYTFPKTAPYDIQGYLTDTRLIEVSPGNFYAVAGAAQGVTGADFLYRLVVSN